MKIDIDGVAAWVSSSGAGLSSVISRCRRLPWRRRRGRRGEEGKRAAIGSGEGAPGLRGGADRRKPRLGFLLEGRRAWEWGSRNRTVGNGGV